MAGLFPNMHFGAANNGTPNPAAFGMGMMNGGQFGGANQAQVLAAMQSMAQFGGANGMQFGAGMNGLQQQQQQQMLNCCRGAPLAGGEGWVEVLG